MKQQWIAYAVVAALSAMLGVAIAGLPSSESVGPTIAAPETVVDATTTTDVALPETTVEAETTTTVETTAPPAESTTTTTTAAETTTTTLPPAPTPPDRATVVVVVANGANIGGLASRTTAELEDLGYVDVSATDGTTIVDTTIVYYADPAFELAAVQLATDLGLDPGSIAPFAQAPDIQGTFEGLQLLAYLGSDLR